MKNIILKINLIFIFVVILFASVAYADDPLFSNNEIDPTDSSRYDENWCKFSVDKDGRYLIRLYYEDGGVWKEYNSENSFSIAMNAGSDAVNRGAYDENGGEHVEQFVLKGEKLYYISIPMGIRQKRIRIVSEYKGPSYGTSMDEIEHNGIQLKEDFQQAVGQNEDDGSNIPQAGVAEKAFSIYFLGFGDYAEKLLGKIFGEDVTIDKLVFNQVDMLNANFFNNTTNSAKNTTSDIVREYINKWFGYFKSLALVVIMILIVAAGIRILLQTPQAKVKAYESLKKIFLAVALIFFFPYVMRFAFEINETIIGYINKANSYGFVNAVPISPYSDADEEELEFRSPKYVSIEGKKVGLSSSENIEIQKDKIKQHEQDVDIMRMIRAFAGVTYRFVYVVLWYIMLAQVYILSFIYVKRYLTIAFLIIVYPLVIIGYVIDGISGKNKGAFNTWSKKFFSSIFLQTIHAIMYGIISGVLVNQILKSGNGTIGSQKINVILMIVVTSFLFSGEKILTKFWKSSIDSSAERKGLREVFRMPRNIMKSFKK